MANDLITRLILENKQFDGNLKRSQKEMQNFRKEISGKVNAGIGNLNQGLGKLGLSLGSIGWGAAIAGGVSFAKMGLEATQQSDGLNNAIKASKQTLESFAGALVTADLSTFSDGLLTAWTRARELSAALDTLGDSLLSKKIFDSRIAYEYRNALIDVDNTALDIGKRQEALNKAKELNTKQSERNLKIQNQIKDIIEETWLAETGQNITAEQIRNLAEVGDEYDDIYAKQQVLNEAGEKGLIDGSGKFWPANKEADKAYKEAQAPLKGYSKEQITLAKNWQKFNVEQRKDLAENLILENQIHQQQQDRAREISGKEKSLNAEANPAGSTTEKTYKSLKDLQKESNVLKHKLSTATDPYVIRQLNEELKKVEDTIKKVTTTIEVKPLENNFKFSPVLSSLQSEIAKVKEQMKNTTSLTEWEQLSGKLKDLTKTYETLNTASKGGSNITTTGVNIQAINEELQAKLKANKEIAKSEHERAAAAAAAAGIQREATFGLIESLGSMIEMNDLSAASFARMVAKVLPQIATLVAARNTQTVAETTSSGGSAGGIPGAIGGLAVGLGLVASILSATVKPKFAGGGIVGDKNLVRINEGEMILNHAQQTRLFNSINSGRMESGSGVGQVQFRIQGQELVGVLKNHDSKFGKK